MDFLYLCLVALLVVLIPLSIQAIYRIAFHPLARYPGPFLAKISDLYGFYHAYKGDVHVDIQRCHEKYGPLVRYGPNDILVNTFEGMNAIYGHKGNVQKGKSYVAFHRNLPSSILTTNVRKDHARKRRVVGQAFSESAIKQYEPAMLKHINIFVDKLQEGSSTITSKNGSDWSKPKDMAHWCDYLTFDIMRDLVFSNHKSLMEGSDDRDIPKAIEDTMRYNGMFAYAPWLLNVGNYILPAEAKGKAKFSQQARSILGARLQPSTDKRDDIFQLLLGIKDPETSQPLPVQELASESTVLIIAGSDTSSTAISATFFYLIHNPSTLERATQEVRTIFTSRADIVIGPQLSQCIYLQACIDEAMRMSPSLAAPLWREVLPGGLSLDGSEDELGGTLNNNTMLPAGTNVATSSYAIHHNPHEFPNPFTFDPDRWFPSPSSPSSSSIPRAANRQAHIPFSYGLRNCIAKPFAWKEMLLTMAHVLYELDMRIAIDDSNGGKPNTLGEGDESLSPSTGRHRKGEYQLQGNFTSKKVGPVMQFRKRRE